MNDPMDGKEETPPERHQVGEPAPAWAPSLTSRNFSREAVDERLVSHLAEMEAKQAPDIAFVILEGAAGAVCDYMAWEAEVQAEVFRDD